MTTIDEIMSEVQSFASTWALVGGRLDDGSMYNMAEAKSEALRTLITQAIAEARADGAREMRDAADALREDADEIFPPTDRGRQASVEARDVVEWYSESIRAMPLPVKREPVRLTDAGIDSIRISERSPWWSGDHWCCEDADWYPLIRAIETAVLAANGLTK